MTLLGNGIATTLGFICGVYWLKWNDSPWVLVPMFAPLVAALIGSLFCIFDPDNRIVVRR